MRDTSTILIQNIFHMLCYAFKVLRQRNYQDVGTEDFAHVQDMLAAILSRAISQQVKQGLYRSYTSIEEQTKTLHGKINLYQTKMLQEPKIRQFDCTHDEFFPDNELNQILKAASLLALRHPEVDQKQKDALRKVLPFFSSISDIDLNVVNWGRLQYHRNNRTYEMLMNICYLLGNVSCPRQTREKQGFRSSMRKACRNCMRNSFLNTTGSISRCFTHRIKRLCGTFPPTQTRQ